MDAAAIVEWNFTPPDYFERDVTIEHEGHEVQIGQGKATARIAPAVYDADSGLRARLHTALDRCFRGVQLESHKPFTLHDPTLVRVDENGKRHHFVELKGGCVLTAFGSADIVVKDAAGNVKVDTRKERIERKLSLAKAIAKHATDAVLSTLMRSHDDAVRKPDHELVHLYEIRDALRARFGNDATARTALGISNDAWKRLGQLCNDEPLRQGRHNGRHADALRDATEGELVEARSITKKMIEAYIDHLESPPDASA